jgi:hypothetical protein
LRFYLGLLQRAVDRLNSDSEALTSLLRVIVLIEDPPASAVAALAPEHVQVVEVAQLRTRLPAYLARRRAILDEHYPLIPPLLALVRDYDPEPTTTEEIWATGLGTDRDMAFLSLLHFHCAALLACARNAVDFQIYD